MNMVNLVVSCVGNNMLPCQVGVSGRMSGAFMYRLCWSGFEGTFWMFFRSCCFLYQSYWTTGQFTSGHICEEYSNRGGVLHTLFLDILINSGVVHRRLLPYVLLHSKRRSLNFDVLAHVPKWRLWLPASHLHGIFSPLCDFGMKPVYQMQESFVHRIVTAELLQCRTTGWKQNYSTLLPHGSSFLLISYYCIY